MTVKCKFCEFEQDGHCLKKKTAGRLAKIKINKRRHCSLYKEDTRRILLDFRKKEAHKAVLKKQAKHRARVDKAIQSLKEKGISVK